MDLNEENEEQNEIFREISSYLSNIVYTDLVDKLIKANDLPITNFLMSKGYQKQDFSTVSFNYIENGYNDYYNPNIFDSTDLKKIIPNQSKLNF